MARREKKIEKKRQKRDQKQRAAARIASLGVVEQMRRAAREPILDCVRSGADGMYQVLFSRRLPTGKIALAMFLIDQYCLGAKNGFAAIVTPTQREDFLNRTTGKRPATPIDPPTVRRYVDDAIAYARRYGFEPHRDAVKGLSLFGDIDPAAATTTFEFGKDGKPFYIAGPNDSDAFHRSVINTLARTAGQGNFHFFVPASPDQEVMPLDEASDSDWQTIDLDDEDADADDE